MAAKTTTDQLTNATNEANSRVRIYTHAHVPNFRSLHEKQAHGHLVVSHELAVLSNGPAEVHN